MKKIFFSAAVLTIVGQSVFAQSDNSQSAGLKLNSTASDYANNIGVQMNSLIKQVFNTSGAATGNPYQLTYSHNNKKTGWGFRCGIGYTHNQNGTNNGGSTNGGSNDDLQLRAGIERAFNLTRKWSAGAGFDLVFNNSNDLNTNQNNNGGDTIVNSTHTLSTTFGGGPMGWLRYHLTTRVDIGTEASWYYTAGTKKQGVIYETWNGSNYHPNANNTSHTISNGAFASPVVFFLMVRF